MPRADETTLVAIPVAEMQWTTAMIAVVVEQHHTAVGKAEQEVRIVSGFDEVEFGGVDGYDEHMLV